MPTELELAVESALSLLERGGIPGRPDGMFCDVCNVFEAFEDSPDGEGDECTNCGEGRMRMVLIVGANDARKAIERVRAAQKL